MTHGGDLYAIFEKYPEMKGRLTDFSANISPLGMPEGVRQAVIASVDQAICYPDPECRQLKVAIAGYIREYYGVNVGPGMILCGNGAADVIFRLVAAIKPRRALVCCPTFGEYEEALRAVGCQLEFYRCDHTLSVREDILGHIHSGLDMMFLCNPNNPTGLLTDPGVIGKIVKKTRETGTILAADECFLDFCPGEKDFSLIPLLSQNQHILVLKSFTKMYGMAGLRLGYGLGGDEGLIGRAGKAGPAWPVNTLAAAAGIAALKLRDHPGKVREYVQKERQYLCGALKERKITFWDSAANYILFQVREPKDLYDRFLKEGIVIRRCFNYRGLDHSFYRAAVNRHEDNEKFVHALDNVTKMRGVTE